MAGGISATSTPITSRHSSRPDQPFVSHYNNQYDAVAGFGLHFLRTGDPRWWRLMVNLARHVRDIDIYRTREDKAAYNGGLFWHTSHYTDAGTATHRTYPQGAAGGGPSAEHNYNAGLALHYFMTGERASREAAIGLGRWVVDMDDGRQTMFRWLCRGATGLASASGSMVVSRPRPRRREFDPRVPRRGAPDVARRSTPRRPTRSFAAAFIRLTTSMRAIYPTPNGGGTTPCFCRRLGWYLHDKAEAKTFDEIYVYARDSLLRYARWMADHERPYLDRPEVLEFPTETWAAQDIRKADVLLWAAQHSAGDERARFLERGRWFYDYSVNFLAASPTGHYTRPMVLLLCNGWREGWRQRSGVELAAPPGIAPLNIGPPPAPFEPQKARARRRAVLIAILTFGATLAAIASWIL